MRVRYRLDLWCVVELDAGAWIRGAFGRVIRGLHSSRDRRDCHRGIAARSVAYVLEMRTRMQSKRWSSRCFSVYLPQPFGGTARPTSREAGV
jgi:hypothetical protein